MTSKKRWEDGFKPLSCSRRAILGACAAVGVAPLVAEPAWAGTTRLAPTPSDPWVIDPASEMSPPYLADLPWAPDSISAGDARRLAPRRTSVPGAGRLSSPRRGEMSAMSAVPFQFRYDEFDIRELPLGIEPYHRTAPAPLTDTGTHDANGVRMVLVGGKMYNHPVAQAQYGIELLESHRITGTREYLDRAKKQAQRLVSRKTLRDGAWFFPYPFNYRLHARYDLYPAPWYSMMAQGQALSLFTRMYQRTGEVAWKTAADATFASFLLPPVAGKPWGVWVVDNLLWLEEYPNPRSVRGDRTYNGHMFSAYGLYDYWVLTKDENAKLLLRGAITTYRDVAYQIRHRQWRSH